MTDYAIFRSGGKQYKVSPGNVIDIEKLSAEPGSEVELSDVLVVFKDGALVVGQPTLEGARVVAQVQEQYKDRKITVFKYKSKVRYRRKKGHRQQYTRLAVKQLLLAGEEAVLRQSTGEDASGTSNQGDESKTEGKDQATPDLTKQLVAVTDPEDEGKENSTTKRPQKPRARKVLSEDASPPNDIEKKPRKPKARKAVSGDASSPPNDIKEGKD
jgi:large subunit ribosomal protein L21